MLAARCRTEGRSRPRGMKDAFIREASGRSLVAARVDSTAFTIMRVSLWVQDAVIHLGDTLHSRRWRYESRMQTLRSGFLAALVAGVTACALDSGEEVPANKS